MRIRKLFAMIAIAAACLPAVAPAAEENAARLTVPVTASEPTIDVGELIDKVAKKSGRRFALESHVAGRISVVGIEADKVDHDTMLAIQRLNGYATTTRNGLVSVFPDALARQQSMPMFTADDPKIGDDELMTRVMQLRSACAATSVPVLRPMMPQYAHLAAHPDTNVLIIVDRAANVRRIAAVAELLDKQAAALKMSCLREAKSSM